MDKSYLLGVDIGGTKTAVLLGTEEPKIIDRIQYATVPDQGPVRAVQFISEQIESILRRNGISPEQVSCTGISCGGPLDSGEGLILSPPNLPGWDRVPITDMLESYTGLPAYIENDANAGALAEWRWGAGRGDRNIIFLTFGTGIGAGLIFDGKLYSGANHLAGEAGHIRLAEFGPAGFGKPGSFEGFCSGGGIAQLARIEIISRIQRGEPAEEWIGKLERITAEDVGKAAERGDAAALSVFSTVGEYLGKGLAMLIDLLNPQKIILGSIYVRCHQFIAPAMRKVIVREALPQAAEHCRIVPAELGESIGDYSSLAIAAQAGKTEF